LEAKVKINVQEWKKLHTVATTHDVSYYNTRPLRQFFGVREHDFGTSYYTFKGLVDAERGDKFAASSVATNHRRAEGEYKTSEEQAAKYRAAFAAWDSYGVPREVLFDMVDRTEQLLKEIGNLTRPGRGVFRPEDFKGGSTSFETWVHALRAHSRGRVHFKGKTLEQQEALIQAALKAAPMVFSKVLEVSP
jgi:hypothetical protein